MKEHQVNKSYQEINAKIKSGDVVVVTAEEMIDIVDKKGAVEAATEIDVVTTGTFAPMCSSGAFLNIGQTTPTVRTVKTLLNNVEAYSGLAAVDCYIGATALCNDDPLNRVYPGEFKYGGGHVIEELVAGETIHLAAESYGTDCYPNRKIEKNISIRDLQSATLCNPRNAYQNYNCAVNLSDKTIFTYMGTLKPHAANANYCCAGELSPLMNDPYYRTIGIGTRIFIGGTIGYVTGAGTQHNPNIERNEQGIPLKPAATLSTIGNMKKMSYDWVRGVSMRGYGVSLALGIGIPIPILNEEMARFTGISDRDIYTQVVDYSYDYPHRVDNRLASVSYKELKSGFITLKGKKVQTVPLSSMVKARHIADLLRQWIRDGKFLIGEPQETIPDGL